jgi:hypothetical protein
MPVGPVKRGRALKRPRLLFSLEIMGLLPLVFRHFRLR